MHIESSIRDFADGTGRVWLQRADDVCKLLGVTFIQLATGERLSGRAAGAVTHMDDRELTALLESFRSAPTV